MLVLREESLQERGTVYSKIAPKEAWGTIAGWAKTHAEFQIHLGSLMGIMAYMEARYDRFKVAGSRMEFKDSRNVNNRLVLEFRDIVESEAGEDKDVNFATIRLDLKSKMFVSITPF
jgi:hypothetical protein